jgi:2-polyprenyl-6-methoxyphenol hydroxylase-like FAD-dependent oxidoreductase
MAAVILAAAVHSAAAVLAAVGDPRLPAAARSGNDDCSDFAVAQAILLHHWPPGTRMPKMVGYLVYFRAVFHEKHAMTDTTCDALIIGAGPVGLTAATELVRLGLKCRIVDRCAAPTDKSKALVMWGRTLELFNHAGIAQDFVAAGMFAKGASIYGAGKRLVQVRVHRDDTAFPQPLMIPQNETERVLNENLQCRGLKVQRQTELVTFVDHGDTIEATLRHADGQEEKVTSRWLLGCDGAHSTVRKELGFQFSGEFEPNDWMLADVHVDGPIAGDEISAYWHRDGVLIFFPFAPGRFRVIADLGRAPITEKPADPTLEQAQAVVDQRGPTGVRLHDPVWLAGFRIHERKVDQYGRGHVFLAGDAAHIHSPAGGQGMNTGMQDAFNLAWKIALVHRGQAQESILQSYTKERSAVGDMVLHDAGLFTRVATLRNPMLQFMRNHLMSLAGKLSAVQERAIAHLSEMAIHYPESPLNGDDSGDAWGSTVAAGDRLPDATVSELRSGKEMRLLEALRGADFTLLVLPSAEELKDDASSVDAMLQQAHAATVEFGDVVRTVLVLPSGFQALAKPPLGQVLGAERQASVATVLVDEKGQVHQRLGLRGAAIALVRPDGYLSFRGHAGSWDQLQGYLARILRPTGAVALATAQNREMVSSGVV